MSKKICRLGCGHLVGNGDAHAVGACPPKRGGRRKGHRGPTVTMEQVKRGSPVFLKNSKKNKNGDTSCR